jgi:hypothetical protein
MKEEGGKWTAPEAAPFSKYPNGGPAFHHEGNKLFFHSLRPRDNTNVPAKDLDLWVVERKREGWGAPEHLNTPLNSDETFESYPTVAKDGTIYLNRGRQGYVKSAYINGKYAEPETIGDLFNTDFVDTCSEMRYLFLFSDKKRRERFDYEIFVSLHKPDGRWSKPIYLGQKLHPGKRATQAMITFDGKYLFFTKYFSFFWVDAKILDDLKPVVPAPEKGP